MLLLALNVAVEFAVEVPHALFLLTHSAVP
jgi:hypothetical protein